MRIKRFVIKSETKETRGEVSEKPQRQIRREKLTFSLAAENYRFQMTHLINGLSKIQYILEERLRRNTGLDCTALIYNFAMNQGAHLLSIASEGWPVTRWELSCCLFSNQYSITTRKILSLIHFRDEIMKCGMSP